MRTRADRRWFREKAIARRAQVVTVWGRFPDVLDHYGRLHKCAFVCPFKTIRAQKNYLAAGVTRRDWDDVVPATNTRQRLKREIDNLLFE